MVLKKRSQREGEEPKMEPRPAKRWRQGPLYNSDAGGKPSSNWEGNSSNNKKFDAFISLCNSDAGPTWEGETRSLGRFCDLLLSVLKNIGLNVFLGNEELQSEERLSEDILEAISCSKVDVCILSSGYAESAWCLEQLEMMLDKHLIYNSLLIPVFYDVKPMEVRHVTGAFGQGFQKLVDKGTYSKEVIRIWRAALGMIAETDEIAEIDDDNFSSVHDTFRGHFDRRVELFIPHPLGHFDRRVEQFIPDLISRWLGRLARREVHEAVPNLPRVVGENSIIDDIVTYRENGLGVTSVEISMGGIGKPTVRWLGRRELHEALGRREVHEKVPKLRVVGGGEQLNSIIDDIMTYRENGLGVTSVEISGIGGIGKTTFAKKLYNQIYTKYEISCFIEDARELVEKHGINEVHTELMGKLFNHGSLDYLKIKKKKLLKDMLHNAEILVVIDNIDSTVPLSTIFFEGDVYLRPTSTIIVTSREDGVLKHDPRVANYCKNLISRKISNLDFHTSKELFLQHAFGGIDNVNNEFDEIINKMVEKCHGVPLALALLGRHVCGRDMYVWDNLYHSITDALTRDLQKILAFSYYNLNTELQKCLFLDVATFFRWEKVDNLLKLRQSDHEDGESALDVLKKKLLIEVEDGVLYMHDILVKLGRSIVRDESAWPGLYSRMWRPDDVKQILSKQILSECSHADVMDIYKTEIKKVRTLRLHGTDASSPVLDVDEDGDPRPWPADAFSEMSSLEVLFLDGHCIEGDLSKLPPTLQWLRWTNFPYQSMPPTLCLNSVRILELSGSPLTRSLNPKLPTNLQGLMSRICRRGRPDCCTKLTQYLRPNANSLFNQLFTNRRLSRGDTLTASL